ncbi:MAG: hypothetical protein ACK5X3_15035 [Pseudomonadota bacterium]|jgi:hypothetical protein
MIKRFFSYARANALRLWWDIIALWYCRKANKALDAFEKGDSDLKYFHVLAEQAGKRADAWDAEMRRVRVRK